MSAAHPTIQEIAHAAGWDLDDPQAVRQLQAHNWRDVTPADLELVVARVDLGSDEALGRVQGRRPSAAAQLVDYAVLRLIAPLAHEIPQWRAWRDANEPDELIAAKAGTLDAIVRLALDGLPGRPREELLEQQLAEAARRWRAGEDARRVAAALERSVEWFRHALKVGRLHLPPDRLRRADLAREAGIGLATFNGAWSRRGVLPPPDGKDSNVSWWWRPTVDTWVTETLTHACPHCPAKWPDLTGLRVHLTKKHSPDARAS